jgi:hypothetical protein
MPAEKGLRLHQDQGLAPVEPTGKPHEGDTRGIRGTPWLHVALLIQRELLAEKEVFRRRRSTGAQAEPQETPGITQQWQQRT